MGVRGTRKNDGRERKEGTDYDQLCVITPHVKAENGIRLSALFCYFFFAIHLLQDMRRERSKRVVVAGCGRVDGGKKCCNAKCVRRRRDHSLYSCNAGR
jgi:hypothetical protein